MTIVVVEPDASGPSQLAPALLAQGLQARSADHIDAVRAAQIILLVAAQADESVLASITTLRLRHADASVLVATQTDDLHQRIACYEAGADECMARSLHPAELAAKIRAMQRRRNGAATFQLLADSDALVDCGALELRSGDRRQGVTKREAELLAILARSNGAPVERARVLREAWGAPAWMTNNSVDVYVGYVRRKLDQIGSSVTVRNVRGSGFQIVRRSKAEN